MDALERSKELITEFHILRARCRKTAIRSNELRAAALKVTRDARDRLSELLRLREAV